jgi:hypothetical protein
MADVNGFGTDDEQDDEAAVAEAAYEVVALKGAGRVLQVVAIIAAALWIVAIITNFWFWWDASDTRSIGGGLTPGSVDNQRLLQTVMSALQGTWGYAIVAVIAYLGATLVRGQSLRLMIAAMDDD